MNDSGQPLLSEERVSEALQTLGINPNWGTVYFDRNGYEVEYTNGTSILRGYISEK